MYIYTYTHIHSHTTIIIHTYIHTYYCTLIAINNCLLVPEEYVIELLLTQSSNVVCLCVHVYMYGERSQVNVTAREVEQLTVDLGKVGILLVEDDKEPPMAGLAAHHPKITHGSHNGLPLIQPGITGGYVTITDHTTKLIIAQQNYITSHNKKYL